MILQKGVHNMLVLSRKINQSIVIGDNIEIMLVDIRGDQIKLGINAPKNVKILIMLKK